MECIIYHYPKCKKSRAGLEFVRNLGIEPLIVNYIEEGISEDTIRNLLRKLNLQASELVRQQEDYYKDFLKHQEINQEGWIKILSEHPRLIRRPIVVSGNNAIVGDPPQSINLLLTAYTKSHENQN